MLVRLLAASIIVGTIVVMSPVRQGATLPTLPEGASTLAATLVRDGLQDALVPGGSTARESEPVRAAVAAAIVRGVVAEQSERLHRTLSSAHETTGKRVVASDTLQPGDRVPGWRGVVAGP